jgi:hypothetical protein
VSSGASLHTDQAGRKLSEERVNLLPPQLALERDTSNIINTMDLQHALAEVEPDRRNLSHDSLLNSGSVMVAALAE